MTLKNNKSINKQSGYTIVELSLTITILAIIASSGLAILSNQNAKTKREETAEKIKVIEKAIKSYVEINGHLPCPASPGANETSPQFGYSSAYSDTSNECLATGNATGMVPVRSLNLNDNFAYDGWERKFSYRIAKGMGSSFDFNDDSFIGDISVTDLNGFEKTSIGKPAPNNYGAVYIIISHGPRGYGSWGKNSASPPNLPPESSREYENVNHTENKIYVQNSPTYLFDNIVSFKQKRDIVDNKQNISPVKIPSQTCSDAESLLSSQNIDNVQPNSLAKQLKISSRAIIELCKNPPIINEYAACYFSPLRIRPQSLVTWLDATNPKNNDALPSHNSSITSWTDRSNSENNAISNGNPPNFNNDGSTPFANNLPSISFNGTNDKLEINTNIHQRNYTIFVVEAMNPSKRQSQYFLGNDNPTPTNRRCLHLGYYIDSNNTYHLQFGHHESNIATNANVTNAISPNLTVAKLDFSKGKTLIMHKTNGAATKVNNQDTNTLMNYSNSKIVIGGDICGGNHYQGNIGEIIIYQNALDDSEIEQIKSYLMRKWFSGECPPV